MIDDFLQWTLESLNAVHLLWVGSPSKQSWIQCGEACAALGKALSEVKVIPILIPVLCFNVQSQPVLCFFTSTKIIVGEGILKIPLSYAVKQMKKSYLGQQWLMVLINWAVNPCSSCDQGSITGLKPPSSSSHKHGNAMWVHQENRWSHQRLPIALTATPKITASSGHAGFGLGSALIPACNCVAVAGGSRLAWNGRGFGGLVVSWGEGLSKVPLWSCITESTLAFTAKSCQEQKGCFEWHLQLLKFCMQKP